MRHPSPGIRGAVECTGRLGSDVDVSPMRLSACSLPVHGVLANATQKNPPKEGMNEVEEGEKKSLSRCSPLHVISDRKNGPPDHQGAFIGRSNQDRSDFLQSSLLFFRQRTS